ncbi:hypothetical protein EV421DRAFT_1850484 [Armillaria borealis]|uniref:Heterokaryon incompatibility domain-containing protein n=1 Tax=Armillaria borealis TaxID=47425 RepID=A0AA39IXA5_9AGAR|nr:hypothetical protein EV421DRAFT_1850484 [Armillaria borealis]
MFSEITLSALSENGQAELTIAVLKQKSYTDRKPVISSVLANTPCADLGVVGLLEKLNDTLGTSYNLDTYETSEDPFTPQVFAEVIFHRNAKHLHSILELYIQRNDDFGTAYAHLRRFLYDLITIEFKHELRSREEEDWRRRQIARGRITTPDIPPRRIWDLYANRVVPYWVGWVFPYGISHAWMEDKERVDVWTPINGYEWPVPIPKDTSLDLIRIEMLNLGVQYVWLDVLCLRQAGGLREDLRAEEWKVDVPTIGYVYQRSRKVVCYFSGLGRPLNLKPGDFESNRFWFNRAWTLQEISEHMIIGGETGDGIIQEDIQTRFHDQLASLRTSITVFDFLSQMKNRGLVYLLHPKYIPIYDAAQSQEDAWVALVNAMEYSSRVELLFLYPEPGNGDRYWRPSWKQVMSKTESVSCGGLEWIGQVSRTEETDANWFEGTRIDSGDVRGLSNTKEGGLRQGELTVNDDTGATHIFKIVANHAYPTPNGSYTLIGHGTYSETLAHFWVIGWRITGGKFKKVSVFSITDEEERRRLQELGIAKYHSKMVLC